MLNALKKILEKHTSPDMFVLFFFFTRSSFTCIAAQGVCVCVCLSLSCVQIFVTPWTVACQAPFVRGILQARILEWVAILFSRGSSRPRNRTQVSCIAGGFTI